MNFKLSFILFLSLVGVFYNVSATISPATLYITQRAQDALQEQMIKYRSGPMARSGISVCHPHYSEVLSTLLDTYEKDIKKCEDTKDEQLSTLTTEAQNSRDITTQSLQNTCEGINVCIGKNTNLDFFDCVDKSGDDNTRDVWKASKDSSDTAARIREQIHVIDFEAGRCTSAAERVYVVETAKATDDMLACFANGGVIPTTPSTEAPSTEAPSTEPPSTEAPSTEAPSTEAPSTEAPSTEASSTEGPSTEAPPTEAPSTEAPSTEEPSTEAPSTEAPSTEAPSTEAPSTEAPSTEAPSTEAPSTEAPSTEAPSTEAPSTEDPSTEAPSTEASSTEAPSTEAPSTEAPSTEAPSTVVPTTEVPPTEAEEKDQVEELEETDVRRKLEDFMRNWGKRF